MPNEAAFYGPKIDVQVWSVIGREFTLATNQVDFAVPARFGLVYRDKDNTEKTPLCIHRAPLGTHERFIGFLIEHYAGNFPLWLAPDQVRVLTIGDDEKLVNYAKPILAELRAHQVRADADFGTDKINGKVLRAEEAQGAYHAGDRPARHGSQQRERPPPWQRPSRSEAQRRSDCWDIAGHQ